MTLFKRSPPVLREGILQKWKASWVNLDKETAISSEQTARPPGKGLVTAMEVSGSAPCTMPLTGKAAIGAHPRRASPWPAAVAKDRAELSAAPPHCRAPVQGAWL